MEESDFLSLASKLTINISSSGLNTLPLIENSEKINHPIDDQRKGKNARIL
jgi:hypothetical protein